MERYTQFANYIIEKMSSKFIVRCNCIGECILYTYQYLRNFSGYLRQIRVENLRQFSYIDHAWLNTPLDPPYQEYPADMFHHLFEFHFKSETKQNKMKNQFELIFIVIIASTINIIIAAVVVVIFSRC